MNRLPFLKKKHQGDEVRNWQRFLQAEDFYNGLLDGDFGNKTERSTKSFQKSVGLKADGLVGKSTYAEAIKLGYDVFVDDGVADYTELPLRLRMAKKIVDFEARRDSKGRIKVYFLPEGDGGGTYEVAGINEKYHKSAVDELVKLIRNGEHSRAENYAISYIATYTDSANQWVDSVSGEFYLRDSMWNRGPRGAARILQRAVNTKDDGIIGFSTRSAVISSEKHDLKLFLRSLRNARENYERKVVGRDSRSKFWNGLVNRWDKSLVFSEDLMREHDHLI